MQDRLSPQSTELIQLQRDLRRNKIRLGFGMALSSIGFTAITTGAGIIVAAAIEDAKHDYEAEPTTGPGLAYLGGGAIAAGGLIPLAVGLPLWVSGRKHKGEVREKLQRMPTVSFSKSGPNKTRLIGLSWTF